MDSVHAVIILSDWQPGGSGNSPDQACTRRYRDVVATCIIFNVHVAIGTELLNARRLEIAVTANRAPSN